ncbi:MAG: TIGR00269 family protein, partial [Nitrosopumilus sp.]
NSLENQHSGIKNNLYKSILKVSNILKDSNYKIKKICEKCGNQCTGEICSVCNMVLKLKESQT